MGPRSYHAKTNCLDCWSMQRNSYYDWVLDPKSPAEHMGSGFDNQMQNLSGHWDWQKVERAGPTDRDSNPHPQDSQATNQCQRESLRHGLILYLNSLAQEIHLRSADRDHRSFQSRHCQKAMGPDLTDRHSKPSPKDSQSPHPC